MYSKNLRAVPYAGKQKQWSDKKVWWFIILTRGKVALKMMPLDWEQTGPGMAEVCAPLLILESIPHTAESSLNTLYMYANGAISLFPSLSLSIA